MGNDTGRLNKAAELTASQLQRALEIVESAIGIDRARTDGALVGAVLVALSANYRDNT
jgi:hypothetical protein